MNLREFWRFHFLKALLGLVIIQLGIFAWLQGRNHRPIAITDEITVIEGKSVTIQPLRNDTDKDEDNILVLQKVSDAIHGKITQNKNTLIYLADVGYVGVDSFTYLINDGKKDSKEAYIKVTINENLKPIANSDNAQVYAENSILLNPIENDNDLEGDSIFIQNYSNPLYGKLKKIESGFIYTSTNNSAHVDSFQYTISDGNHESEKATVYIDVKSKNVACYPWLSADIGNTYLKGGSTFENNTIIVKASGSDVWDNNDGFNYTYQYIKGDCGIVAKVESIENTHEWAKAGVMIRETLKGDSKNIFIGMSAQHGATFQRRSVTGNGSESLGQNGEVKTPYWIKLVRKGNNFTCYTAPDGKKWKELGSTDVVMSPNVYVGLCFTSHDNSKIGTTVYSNYSLKGNIGK